MKNKTEIATIMEDYESKDINVPLQKLFDDCLNFISMYDFTEE